MFGKLSPSINEIIIYKLQFVFTNLGADLQHVRHVKTKKSSKEADTFFIMP